MLDTAYMNSNAADCLRLAGQAESARQRALMLSMAKAWVALSQQASEIRADHGVTTH